MQNITYKPIGIIHTPFKSPSETPIQPSASKGKRGSVEIFPEYVAGLQDLDRFSHVILIYHFHLSGAYSLQVKPFLDDQMRGVFATRAPARPNPIGHSVVRLTGIEGNVLFILTKNSGVLMQALQEELRKRAMEIPFKGIRDYRLDLLNEDLVWLEKLFRERDGD